MTYRKGPKSLFLRVLTAAKRTNSTQKRIPLTPQTFNTHNSQWESFSPTNPVPPSRHLEVHATLPLISWNIDFAMPFPSHLTTALLTHLKRTIPQTPTLPMISLQEISPPAKEVILESSWIQENFTSLGLEPPRTIERVEQLSERQTEAHGFHARETTSGRLGRRRIREQ